MNQPHPAAPLFDRSVTIAVLSVECNVSAALSLASDVKVPDHFHVSTLLLEVIHTFRKDFV